MELIFYNHTNTLFKHKMMNFNSFSLQFLTLRYKRSLDFYGRCAPKQSAIKIRKEKNISGKSTHYGNFRDYARPFACYLFV